MLSTLVRYAGGLFTHNSAEQGCLPAMFETLETRVLLTAIISGERVEGAIAVLGEIDTYTFSANTGDSAIVSIGQIGTHWRPQVEILSPDGTSLGTASGSASASFPNHNVQLELLNLPQNGTYSIIASGVSTTGLYALSLAKLPGVQHVDSDSGPIASGEHKFGMLNPGDLDIYTYNVNIGDSMVVSVGQANTFWRPRIDLFASNGQRVATNNGSSSASFPNHNVQVEVLNATIGGIYYAVVRGGESTAMGEYGVSVVKVGGPQHVDSDSGPIASGERKVGSLGGGDLDVYTFNVNMGDSMVLSLGQVDNTFWRPQLDLFSPTGQRVGAVNGNSSSSFPNRNLQVELLNATVSGTYYAIVRAGAATATGDYGLSLAKLPGSQTTDGESGPILSGERKTGALQHGDLDIYTFQVNAGDSMVLALGQTDVFWQPRLDLFAPNGQRVGTVNGSSSSSFPNRNLQVELLNATVSGTYYAVVRAGGPTMAGNYGLSLAKLGGPQVAEGDSGPIVSGVRKTGIIDAGDIDVHTFPANIGDSIVVSLGHHGPFWSAQIDLYSPSGSRVATNSGSTSSSFPNLNVQVDAQSVTEGGTYYAVVRTNGATFQGHYGITMARIPGSQPLDGESGPIGSNERRIAHMSPGDLDIYTFEANAGDSVIAIMGRTETSMQPRLDLYAPNGQRLGNDTGPQGAAVQVTGLLQSGTYYLVARSNSYTHVGNYAITLARVPGVQVQDVTDNDGGPISSGQTMTGAIAAGDLTVYTLDLSAGAATSIQVNRVGTSSYQPRIQLFSPTGQLLGNQTGSTSATLNLASAPVSGTYYVVVRENGDDAVGTYSIGVDVAPGTDTRPPEVTAAEFRYNAPKPHIAIRFNESVAASVSVTDLVLENLTDNDIVPSVNLSVVFNALSNEVIFEFAGYPNGVLPDGVYEARLLAGSIEDSSGNVLPSQHAFRFFALAGDANRDGAVSIADLGILAANWQKPGMTFSHGDFNYDGSVGIADLGILAANWQKTLDLTLLESSTAPEPHADAAQPARSPVRTNGRPVHLPTSPPGAPDQRLFEASRAAPDREMLLDLDPQDEHVLNGRGRWRFA
jgi:hypothetical protein